MLALFVTSSLFGFVLVLATRDLTAFYDFGKVRWLGHTDVIDEWQGLFSWISTAHDCVRGDFLI